MAAGIALAAGCGTDESVDEAGRPSSTATTQATTTMTAADPAATSSTRPEELTEESRLRLDGIGPLVVRMTLEEASAAIGRPVRVEANSLFDGENSVCGMAEPEGGPAGLSFMILRDSPADAWRIYRFDVYDTGRIATGAGIRIGATEDDVKEAYGNVGVEGHQYVEDGHYLTVDLDGPAGNLLLFETDGVRVTQFRSGAESPVRFPEGCA